MSTDPTGLIQFGVLGVIIFLILFGWLWAKPSVDQLKVDKEKAEQERDSLFKLYQDQVLPALINTNEIIVPLLKELQTSMHDMQVARDATDNRRSS